MNNINIAIVGLGSIAEYHLRSFSNLPDVNLRAVMSRKKESVDRVMNKYGVEKGFRNYDELLADDKTNAIVLCTPNNLHFEMAKSALNAGKHVLVEKPVASSMEEAKELCHIAEKNKGILMVAMTARFTPQYLKSFHAIRKGEIGDIIQIIIRWFENKTIGINWEKKKVPVDKKTSTVLYQHGSHMLDASLWFINEQIEEVYAVGSKRQVLNDDVSILVKTKKGKIITSTHSFNSLQKIHDMVVLGTKGVIEIKGYEQMKVNGVLRVNTTWQEGFEQGVNAQSKEFIASIRDNKDPISSGKELLVSFNVLEKAYLQLKKQGLT